MKLSKIDHVGIIVNDLSAAKAFFLYFGLEVQGEDTSQTCMNKSGVFGPGIIPDDNAGE